MIQIPLRAERKVGQLLKEVDRAKPGDKGPKPNLAELGITKDQSSKFQQLADVPEKELEEAIADPEELPSTQSVGLTIKASS